MRNARLLPRFGTRWTESQRPGSQRSTDGKPEPASPDDDPNKALKPWTAGELVEGRNVRPRGPRPRSPARGKLRVLLRIPSLTLLDTRAGKKSPVLQPGTLVAWTPR